MLKHYPTPCGRLMGSTVLSAALMLGTALPAEAQQETEERTPWPFSNVVLTGYGVVGYDAELRGDFRHDFDTSLAPILLFDLGGNLLFETELKFAPHGDGVDVEMEYAQVSYLGFERLIVTAGKFLLPFGVFGERLHAAWINRMPSMPLVYAHAHGGVASGALLPVLSDLGVMARYALPMDNGWRLDLSGWISQGPRMLDDGGAEPDDHAHSQIQLDPGSTATGSSFDIPTVAYGITFASDNDQRNRMLGARVGLLRPPSLEVYVSAFHAKYNPGDYLDLVGTNLAAEWRRGELEVRGEAAVLWQEFVHDNAYVHLRSPAYYVQASRRFGAFEPVLRWSELPDATVDGQAASNGTRQFAVGLNYWLQPAVPIKAAYEFTGGGNDRLLLQWALGF